MASAALRRRKAGAPRIGAQPRADEWRRLRTLVCACAAMIGMRLWALRLPFGRRHFVKRGGEAKPGREDAPRERSRLRVIASASEAIQNVCTTTALDCFGALAPRNDTAEHPATRTRPGLQRQPSDNRGRRECRVRGPHPRPRVRSKEAHEQSHHRCCRQPAFPARWFYGLLRALPGVHDVLVTVIGAMQSIVANLTPAKGRQDHTTSPSAQAALVSRAVTSIASRLTCRDDRDTPLVARPGWRDKPSN